jgi:hypothetical protein
LIWLRRPEAQLPPAGKAPWDHDKAPDLGIRIF